MRNENDLQLQINKKLNDTTSSTLKLSTNELKLITQINDPAFFLNLFAKHKKTAIAVMNNTPSTQSQIIIPVDSTANSRLGGNIFGKINETGLSNGSLFFLGFTQASPSEKSQLILFNPETANLYLDESTDEQTFISRGYKFSLSEKTNSDWSELHKIIAFGDLQDLQDFFKKPQSVNALTKATLQKLPPLHMAIGSGSLSKVQCLLDHSTIKIILGQEGLSLRIAAQKYSESPQDPQRLTICVVLIKKILEKGVLGDLKKNPSQFIFDLSSTTELNDIKMDSNTLTLLFDLQKLDYVKNMHLWLRQLLLSTLNELVDTQIPFNQDRISSIIKSLENFSNREVAPEIKLLFSGILHQFSNSPDFSLAEREFNHASVGFCEAYLLLGYQFATGKGQQRNYKKAKESYFTAFTKANEERFDSNRTTHSDSDNVLLLKIEDAAISSLKKLLEQQPPSLPDKERVLVHLAMCYFRQGKYKEAQQQIEITQVEQLQPQEQEEFKTLAANVNYQLAATAASMEEKIKFLKRASNLGHGKAALALVNMAINKQPQSDFYEASLYCINALTASRAVDIKNAKEQFFKCFDKLSGLSFNERVINTIIFKAAAAILKKMQTSDENWPFYKDFLQTLAKRKQNLPAIEYALFSCYALGRAVTLAELEISSTKKMGPITKQKSDTDIQKEKNQKINNKLKEITEADPQLAQHFSAVINAVPELTVEATSSADSRPLYPIIETANANDFIQTVSSNVQIIPTESNPFKEEMGSVTIAQLQQENNALKNLLAEKEAEINVLKAKLAKQDSSIASKQLAEQWLIEFPGNDSPAQDERADAPLLQPEHGTSTTQTFNF